jgi:hypothetical protein
LRLLGIYDEFWDESFEVKLLLFFEASLDE